MATTTHANSYIYLGNLFKNLTKISKIRLCIFNLLFVHILNKFKIFVNSSFIFYWTSFAFCNKQQLVLRGTKPIELIRIFEHNLLNLISSAHATLITCSDGKLFTTCIPENICCKTVYKIYAIKSKIIKYIRRGKYCVYILIYIK